MNSPQSERKILLAVREGHIDPRLLASARSLGERMGAEIDILARFAGESLPPALAEFVQSLRTAGIAYTLTCMPTMRRRDIVRYANSHECVASVVIDSLEDWESVAADRASDPWTRLACPLVTAALPKTATND